MGGVEYKLWSKDPAYKNQDVEGAMARKPTRLGSVCFPELKRQVRRLPNAGRCCHSQSYHEAQLGLDDQDRWRTAPLKEYPSRMCQFIATAFAQAIRRRCDGRPRTDEWWPIDQEIAHFYQPVDPFPPERHGRGLQARAAEAQEPEAGVA